MIPPGDDAGERAGSSGPTVSANASPSLFLERQSYRRRRVKDAARLLPLLGAALFAIPLLWPGPDDAGAVTPVRMSDAILYIFAVWAMLIAVSALIGIRARYWTQGDGPDSVGPDRLGPDGSGPNGPRQP